MTFPVPGSNWDYLRSYFLLRPSGDSSGKTDTANINGLLADGQPVFLLPSAVSDNPYFINAPITPVTGSVINGFNWWAAANSDTYNPGIGQPGGALIIMVPGFTGPAGIAMINTTGSQRYGVDISGITLLGYELGSGPHGILIDGAWGAGFLRGVQVYRPPGDCLHFATDSTSGYNPDDWLISQCNFKASRNGRGVYADNIPDSWFTDCEASANQLDNWLIGSSTNTRFSSCKGEGSNAGAGFHFGGFFSAGEVLSLTQCNTQFNSQDGFLFDAGSAGAAGTYLLANCNSLSDGQAGGTTYASYRSNGCKSRIMASGCYGAGAAYGAYEGSSSYGMCFTGSYLAGTTAATHDDGTNTHALVNQSPVPF